MFKNKTGITSFDELTHFPAVKQLNDAFNGSTLVHFQCPPSLEIITNSALRSSSLNMDLLELPTTLKTIGAIQVSGYLGKIVVNSNITSFTPGYCYGRSHKGTSVYTFVLNVTAVIPIETTGSQGQYSNRHYYYVPDALLDQYRSASGWSGFPSHILPISELPTP